jgi:O-antigen/teichoic acid export membrane protein
MIERSSRRLQMVLRASGRRGSFTRNVTSTFAVQIVALIVTIVNSAIIARVLGPDGKGILALVLLTPNILALLLSGGIGVANIYYAGRGRLPVADLSSNSSLFAVAATLLGVLIIGLLYATSWLETLLPGVPIWLVAVGLLGLPFSLLNGYYAAILQGLQRIPSINRVTLGQRLLTLLLTALFLLALALGIGGALAAALLASAAATIALALLLIQQGGQLRPRWQVPVVRTTLAFGLRGYVGNVLQFFNYRLDLFLVNFFLGPAGAGIYTVAIAMAEMLWYLPNAVGFVIFPKAANTSQAEMNRFTPRIFRVTLALTAAGGVVLALVGKPLIEFIYSPAFASAFGPLLALLPGVVLLGAAKVLTNEIAGRGYPHYNSITAGVALVLTVTFDLLLIPRWGVLGAAIASSIAYSVIFFLSIGFYRAVSRRAERQSRS